MADYIVSENDISLLKQRNRESFVKIEFLNEQLIPLCDITGDVISGHYSFDSASDIRKTASLEINIQDCQIDINNQLLLTSCLRIWVGFYSFAENQIKYYNEGIYIFDSVNSSYDLSTNKLSLSCIDYIANFDIEHKGSLINGNGTIGSALLTLKAGENIRQSLINVITDFGIKDYQIEEMGTYYQTSVEDNNKLPHDLEFKAGDSLLNLIVKLRDLYPSWEAYFDKNGVFICRLIPTLESDDIMLPADTMNELVISENPSHSLKDIKNIINVWGKELEVDRYTDKVSTSSTSTTYNATFESFTEANYVDNMIIGLKMPSTNRSISNIRINSLASKPILDYVTGTYVKAGTFYPYEIYLFKYSLSKNCFYYAGQYQVHGLAYLTANDPNDSINKENAIAGTELLNYMREKYNCENISYTVNSDSPYCVEYVGELVKTCSGDDYSNIYYDSLALYNADYELWKSSRVNDSITLEMILVPWLDVNMKIEYKKQNESTPHQYIIKSIESDIGSCTMTITAMRFYNLYKNTEK